MKIYGVFDPNREGKELKSLLERMALQLNPEQCLGSENFVAEKVGVGHLYSEAACKDKQPIWNEDKTKFIVMVGRIFDYEELKKDLMEKGHVFEYFNSDAEFVLHGFEEWGRQLIENLNGFFVFMLSDLRRGITMIANDRCGMKPLFYYHSTNLFLFASEVKAIIEDEKVDKEINWDAWRDFFSYGFMIGIKTPFRDVFSILPGTIISLTNSGQISFDRYWDYTQIMIDHQSSEQYFVSKGAELLKQAILRQALSIDKCTVLLSGGYDSRSIATSLGYYTGGVIETLTTRPSFFLDSTRSIVNRLFHCLDPIIAKEVAQALKVKNTYIPKPRNLYGEHQIEKVFLLDGMCLEHLWMLPVVDKLKGDKVNFDGLAGDILLRGALITSESLANWDNNEKLAYSLDRILRRYLGYPTEDIVNLFKNPICEKLAPRISMITDEIKKIGNHENIVTIFHMRNRTKNSVSLMPNNLIGKRAFCLFPFLDKDLVEFSLAIPPSMKINNKIYARMLMKMFPSIMKIPATTFLSFASIKKWGKKYFAILPYLMLRFIFRSRCLSECKEVPHLLRMLDSLVIPEYLDVKKTKEMTYQYLRNGKDPMPFLVPIVEFCIWYNLFLKRSIEYNTLKHKN